VKGKAVGAELASDFGIKHRGAAQGAVWSERLRSSAKTLQGNNQMIELHTWGTPNGRKISIMLEECGLPYSVHKIDISKGEQFKPEFLAISPNNRIPRDRRSDGPGGKRTTCSSRADPALPRRQDRQIPAGRQDQHYDTVQWLMWQMAVSVDAGASAPFPARGADQDRIRHQALCRRSQATLRRARRQLAKSEFVAGAEYTIADMSIFPWASRHEWHTVDLAEFAHVKRCVTTSSRPPAVVKGMAVPYLN